MKKTTGMRLHSVTLTIAIFITSCGQQVRQDTAEAEISSSSDSATLQIAYDAYIFGYPLVLMDASKKLMTNVESPGGMGAPINQVVRREEFPDDKFHDVVKPNSDTYYASAWLDLSGEPLVLQSPNTNGRYFLIPLLDAWTNVFSSPGKRTTGTSSKTFLITGPGWNGQTPAGMELLKSPTNMVWVIGRTQVNNKQDGATTVKKIQQGIILTPLSAYGKPYTPPKGKVDAAITKKPPVDVVREMSIEGYFNRLAHLMAANPPAPADSAIVKKMNSIGLEPGKPFDSSKMSAALFDSLKSIPARANQLLKELSLKSAKPVNGWLLNRGLGDYKTNYMQRAIVALVGLGANLDADALYPMSHTDGDGNPYDGSKNNYVLHFDPGQEPPVNAFWSLTMYGTDDFMVANPINRFAIGDRDKMKKNPDGSQDIYIQKDSPGKAKESNWLPAPGAPFQLALRLYWPKESVLNGDWAPPPVKRVQ